MTTSTNAAEPTTTRFEAFSDGVFAIAITLLVIEIRPPDEQQVEALGGLGQALLGLWPSYAGYVISFITIGINLVLDGYRRRTDAWQTAATENTRVV